MTDRLRRVTSCYEWWSQWTRKPGAGRQPHLSMESEATPLRVSCQGWTRQGLVGKGQPPLSSGLPFPLLSPSVLVPQDLAKGRRDPSISLSRRKVHQPEIQEQSRSHRPSAPVALSGGLHTHVGAVPRPQLEFVAETGRGPYQEPSQAADIPAQRQPGETAGGKRKPAAQATFQPLRDLQTAR